ncbi:DUF4386 domain-containing protein [Saccharicrinis sp. FJH62]|uniref:DUF4386 domain-containing protein n=1 Tax=Saccharicrinis sp. FJH62 TaxID=3344657 RepID=UPI0035D4707F
MNTIQTVLSVKKNARIAGILYLIIIIAGLFSEMFVRSSIVVPGDALTTAQNILNHSVLYRVGFVSDLIMIMSDVAVALLFYLLLKPVSKGLSLLAAFFRLGQATVLGLNLLNYYMPLLIFGDNTYLSSFSGDQLSSLALLFINAHSYGYLISGVFFGISCIIVGSLMYNAEYFPKWLGILIIAAGISYLVDCFVNFLGPEFSNVSEILVVTIAVAAELTLCLYLLVKGIKADSGNQITMA